MCQMDLGYGYPIGSWCTDKITDMSDIFYGMSTFNKELYGWDTSKVTTFNSMFSNSGFNQLLTNFDTSAATVMSYMFAGSPFNQRLDHFDVSNVISMERMFATSLFNQDISMWNLASLKNAEFMFYANHEFNQCVANFGRENYVAATFSSYDRMFLEASSCQISQATPDSILGPWCSCLDTYSPTLAPTRAPTSVSASRIKPFTLSAPPGLNIHSSILKSPSVAPSSGPSSGPTLKPTTVSGIICICWVYCSNLYIFFSP